MLSPAGLGPGPGGERKEDLSLRLVGGVTCHFILKYIGLNSIHKV